MAQTYIQADTTKNRLYIKVDGFISDADTQLFADQVIEEAKKLKAPFDAVSDLNAFKPATPQGFEYFKQAAEAIVHLGLRKMARVDSTSVTGSMQLNRLSRTAGYEAIVVRSWDEAEKVLDSLNA